MSNYEEAGSVDDFGRGQRLSQSHSLRTLLTYRSIMSFVHAPELPINLRLPSCKAARLDLPEP